jgi:hypothetical protein
LDIANKRLVSRDTELRAKEGRIVELETELVITKHELQAQEDALVEMMEQATRLQWNLNDAKQELENIVPGNICTVTDNDIVVLEMETKLNKRLFKMVKEANAEKLVTLKKQDRQTSTQTSEEPPTLKIPEIIPLKENANPNSPKKAAKRVNFDIKIVFIL